MKIEARQNGTIPVLAPQGRVTIGESALALKTALDEALQAGAPHIILDGARMEYLDSTGIGEIIAAARRLSESGGGRIGIARPSPKLREIFEITGLRVLFIVADTEEGVVEALAVADPARF